MKKDGSQDFTLVKEVFMDILSNKISSTIILKSTVIPSNIKIVDNLIKDYIYNPEFLREKHAEEDFINSNMIILGGSKNNQKSEEFV